MRRFFRVNNYRTGQGLWYDWRGDFTGLIHKKFDFCQHRDLAMDFDPDLVGWLSVTPTLEELYHWFPEDDIRELAKHGWYVHEYEVAEEDCRFYERFQHWVIRQGSEKLIAFQNFGHPL